MTLGLSESRYNRLDCGSLMVLSTIDQIQIVVSMHDSFASHSGWYSTTTLATEISSVDTDSLRSF
jgi:hypothetical protein